MTDLEESAMKMAGPTATRSRRELDRVLDVAVSVAGAAAATVLVSNGINDAREAGGWPRWLELTYVIGILLAVLALTVVAWARMRLKDLGAAIVDERIDAAKTRALATALLGVLCAQLPFFFHVEIASVAQAKFTVAAAVLTYGLARLWFNRDV